MSKQINRRQLCLSAFAATALVLPGVSPAAAARPRRLRFYHTHTGEKLDIVYAESGQYLADALGEIDHLLRDFRSGEIHPIEPALLDVLHAAQSRLGNNGRFDIISAYRSPATNAALRNKSGGVAKKSLHMQGKAIDVRLPGTPTDHLRRAARELRAGGVGYYPGSDFVHVDTGHVRFW